MNIGENIKKARAQAKLTQGQLAEMVQVNQKDISRWENGDRTPNIFFIKKICEATGVSADTILEINISNA